MLMAHDRYSNPMACLTRLFKEMSLYVIVDLFWPKTVLCGGD